MFFGKIIISVFLSLVTMGQGEDGALWERPCDGRVSSRVGSIFIHRHRGISTELQLLGVKLATGRRLCYEIQNRIIRWIGDSTADFLDGVDPLLGFPIPTRLSYAAARNIRELLAYQNDQISRLGVFLEQVFDDPIYIRTEEQRDLKTKYREILCQIHILLHSRGHRPTRRISRDVLPSIYRSVESVSDRYQRDYLIMRDTRVIFSQMAEQLTVYLSS